jgi:nucleotide-binding universal stress UspA family protein
MKTETLESVKTNTSCSAGVTLREEVTAPSGPAIQLKNILVPLDFSEMSLKSLQYAVPFAKQFGAKITLLHVVSAPVYSVDFSYYPPLRPEQLAGVREQLEGIRDKVIPAEVSVEIAVRENLVFDGIVEEARAIRADLIIATTHGRTGLKHLVMGSTAEEVVRRAPCPVFVVRETEHDFV